MLMLGGEDDLEELLINHLYWLALVNDVQLLLGRGHASTHN